MSTLLDEHPAAPEHEPHADRKDQGAGPAPPGDGPAGAPASHPARAAGPRWSPARNGACSAGAAAPGALERSPWRSTGLIVAVIAALALGAAAAAVAALNQQAPAARRVTNIVAAAPAATPPASTPAPAPKTPPPATSKAPLPTPAKHLPKLPTTTSTPPATPTTGTSTTGSTTTGEAQASTGTEGGTGEGSESSSQPSALLLDTDAASTYNPYNLPASYFGDPSLTIDGANETTWTAQVNPATAAEHGRGGADQPQVAEEALGARARQPDQGHGGAGLRDGRSHAARVDHRNVVGPADEALRDQEDPHTFQAAEAQDGLPLPVLWISKAPASAVGTPTAPGHVKIGEIELFPASGVTLERR